MIPILAETDTNTMILGVATIIGTAFGGYLSYQLKSQQIAVKQVKATLEATTEDQNRKLDNAAVAVEEVKSVLLDSNSARAETLEQIAADSSKTLKLADGVMTKQLEMLKEASQELADRSGEEKHAIAAKNAADAVDDHDRQKKELDL